jgi:hypothetical protein
MMPMKTNQRQSSTAVYPFVSACSASCRKLVARIQNVKRALLAEFRQGAYTNNRMFQLALNEAEAMAHETGFPHLVFPTLAREKIDSVAAWNRHQQVVRRSTYQRLAADGLGQDIKVLTA